MSLKGLEITVEAATPIITTDDAKTFLRVDGSDDDALIALTVTAATKDIENHLRRALITQTFKLTMDGFDSYGHHHNHLDEYDVLGPGVHNVPRIALLRNDFFYIPRVPIQSVTSVTTYDEANTGSVFDSDDYTLDTVNGRIYLDSGAVWPTSLRDKNAVETIYVAGYGDAATDIPANIIRAIYSQLRNLYFERGDCAAGGLSDSIIAELSGYKIEDYLGFS